MTEEMNTYLQNQVASATPAQLIDMLFDRARRDLASAMDLFSTPEDAFALPKGVQLVVHAQQIVNELRASLKMEEGGELAANLGRLYEYMQFRLSQAVSTRSTQTIQEVADLMGELHEAWHTVVEAERAGSIPGRDSARLKAGVLVA